MLPMIHAQIVQPGSRGPGSHVLSPRIRENEPFRMTIESGGQEYTFEGYLTQTDIQMEQDDIELDDFTSPYRALGVRRYTVDLSIAVQGEIQRALLSKKGPKNVQR